MIVVAGAVLGIIIGAYQARKHGGRGLDQLQYAAGYGIAFALLGLFLTIFIENMA